MYSYSCDYGVIIIVGCVIDIVILEWNIQVIATKLCGVYIGLLLIRDGKIPHYQPHCCYYRQVCWNVTSFNLPQYYISEYHVQCIDTGYDETYINIWNKNSLDVYVNTSGSRNIVALQFFKMRCVGYIIYTKYDNNVSELGQMDTDNLNNTGIYKYSTMRAIWYTPNE